MQPGSHQRAFGCYMESCAAMGLVLPLTAVPASTSRTTVRSRDIDGRASLCLSDRYSSPKRCSPEQRQGFLTFARRRTPPLWWEAGSATGHQG
ncbi:hypothetical protein K491DRAFT_131394 [Lophiostoma macrostomum CBS 122681]|uniref:Uncharacterized protein n=1 Tax=Lophiostoma macrostomum CBS 122681 TaxID=1314788 RepID=A0A6A6SRS9_9PLEO|nr:hypothetical protein K491DRAFT_131394 [Lophiostoma macrostomum CBS 122681]